MCIKFNFETNFDTLLEPLEGHGLRRPCICIHFLNIGITDNLIDIRRNQATIDVPLFWHREKLFWHLEK